MKAMKVAQQQADAAAVHQRPLDTNSLLAARKAADKRKSYNAIAAKTSGSAAHGAGYANGSVVEHAEYGHGKW